MAGRYGEPVIEARLRRDSDMMAFGKRGQRIRTAMAPHLAARDDQGPASLCQLLCKQVYVRRA
jgi:hypothetical protein